MAAKAAAKAAKSNAAGAGPDDGRNQGAPRGIGSPIGVKKQGHTEEFVRADRAGNFSRGHSIERNSKTDARRLNSTSTFDVDDTDGENEVEAPNSPKVVGGINGGSNHMQTSEASQGDGGSVPNSPKVVGDITGGSNHMPTSEAS